MNKLQGPKAIAVLGGAGVIIAVLATWLLATPRTNTPQAPEPWPPLSLLVEKAALIVFGRVESARDIIDDVSGSRLPYHVGEIAVERALKGQVSSARIEVRDLGGRDDRGLILSSSDEVTFMPGEQVILFLEWLGPSNRQYLSPLALQSGKFTVVDDRTRGRLALAGDELAAWQERGTLPARSQRPLEVEKLLDKIEHLVND